ncbi:two-component system OmpR family sensor kinase [Cellulosimicrobium cellulans]|uniref:sensor histidine kinase n=1 Tax=Cellulosimicrobium cellulans TaxID=1710 RepID=UPI00195A252C|nr:HAMP domain-containing sensor histidine kinase [Cellulosimicrobium cellulans]MBM7820186.1 two-component system OmpR family sensor kinase [Cellulosimicrobium cellulans]
MAEARAVPDPARHGSADGVPARRPTALRRRLVLVLAGVVLLVTVGLAAASALALRDQLVEQLDHELEQASSRLAQGFGERPGDGPGQPPADTGATPDPSDLPDDPSRFPAGTGPGSAVLRYVDGAVVLAEYVTPTLERIALDDAQIAALEDVPADGTPHDADLPDLGSFRAVHRTTDDGQTVVVASSTATVDATVEKYVLIEVALGAAGLLAAVLLGTWLVRRSLRPLDDVATAAGRVSELELAQGEIDAIPRVPDDLTDERTEVGQVGAALNRMLENVETSLQARHDSETQVRQFVADASHELRTPLASIRGYAELVRRSPDDVPPATARSLDRIESEAVRMTGLVEDLLLLARLDAGRPLDRAPVDLAALAVDAVMDAHAAGPDHDWALDLPGAGDLDVDLATDLPDALGDGTDEDVDLEVLGDEASLRQVLANLVANARTHTPPGTHVAVRLTTDRDDVVLTVADDGPGIPAALRPTLFRRFTRGDDARNRTGGSTGLGLAIADAIVTAHGGTITVSSSTPDDPGPTGTTFTVTLPRDRP